jgi:hypothetical protein
MPHIPPSVPLWCRCPLADSIPSTESLDDLDFFYHGGYGGSTSIPKQKLNGLGGVTRLWIYTIDAPVVVAFFD